MQIPARHPTRAPRNENAAVAGENSNIAKYITDPNIVLSMANSCDGATIIPRTI